MAAESVIGSVSSRAPCQIGRTRPPTILIVAPPFGVDRHHLAIEDLDDALRGWPPEQHVRRAADAAAVAADEQCLQPRRFFSAPHDNCTASRIIRSQRGELPLPIGRATWRKRV